MKRETGQTDTHRTDGMKGQNSFTAEGATFSPNLTVQDPLGFYWMQQVTIRLRREVCWRRNEGGIFADSATDSLSLRRFREEKENFFKTDPTAKYLTAQLHQPPPPDTTHKTTAPGSFGDMIRRLNLDNTAAFVLALGLTPVFDNAVGSVIAICLNDAGKPFPTLSLAQRLWDTPEEVSKLADPSHPIFRFGLLQVPTLLGGQGHFDWDAPIAAPTLVASQLLFPHTPLPHSLVPIDPIKEKETSNQEFTKEEPETNNGSDSNKQTSSSKAVQAGGPGGASPWPAGRPPGGPPEAQLRQVAAALEGDNTDGLRIVPILGDRGAAHLDTLRGLTALTKRPVLQCLHLPGFPIDGGYFKSLATYCRLKKVDLFLGPEIVSLLTAPGDQPTLENRLISLRSIPIVLYISIQEQNQLSKVPSHLILPKLKVPVFSFQKRKELWFSMLGSDAEGLEPEIAECSRRFRYQKETLTQIISSIKSLPGKITARDLIAACRARLELDMGDLARLVTPRFQEEELILPHRQDKQFLEVLKAMRSLTQVHYQWGTAKVWNESGISVLFAGSPGTGKTMAAEILARDLQLPMYRIDLSQVVNKYIGETEKNLKRLFDSADISDIILFFDEADSLFGKRTEVKDAHDRYANLEISYLLERMERFKGLAILATNRKKDLDEAFLRRLRYIIDFPFPGVPQRKRIWQQVIPGSIDFSDVDIDFLATQFQLTGGHIRSIVFNACLQCADGPGALRAPAAQRAQRQPEKPKLTMEQMIIAVKREYDKLDRTVSMEHFGPYAGLIKGMEKTADDKAHKN